MQTSSVIILFFISNLAFANKVIDCNFTKKNNLKVFDDKRILLTQKNKNCHGTIERSNKLEHMNGFRYDFEIFISKCLISGFKNQTIIYSYYNMESKRTSVVTDINSKVLILNKKPVDCKITFVNSNLFKEILPLQKINKKKRKKNKK